MPYARRRRGRRLIKAASYKAPELCVGGLFNFPVDLWAYGCVLESPTHRRQSFPCEAGLRRGSQSLEEAWHAHTTTRNGNTLARAHTNNTPSLKGVGLPGYDLVE